MTMKKENRKIRKFSLWLTVLAGVMTIAISIYNYHPKIDAYRYALAYNKKDFEKVYSFYKKESIIDKFTKEQIISVLEEQSKINEKIKFKDVTMIKDQETNKWFVKFPYSLQSIYIFTPTGATVYVDNKKIAKDIVGKGIEVREMLPGKHQVKIEYYNNMYPPFTRQIDVPKEQKVESPYETQNAVIVAPLGTWVKLGNITQENLGKEVLFQNILPGQYDMSIYMGDKDIEVFSQKIQIDKETNRVHVGDIKGNEKVREDLEVFFGEFNKAYKEGIIKRDSLFLHKFLTDKINEDVISDFNMWYLDNKDIKDAKSLMEVRDIYPISGTELKASVLETVYLVNQEKNEVDEEINQQYRVVIEWDYKLKRSNSTWKIVGREIRQSIVAYKNTEGKWIKY